MSIMQDLDNTFYDEILERCTKLLGPENLPEMRPGRATLRSFLKDVAIVHSRDLKLSFEDAIKIVAAEKEQRRVKDDVDPLKLQRELEEAEAQRRTEQPKPAPKLSQREKMDNSLGVLMAEELGAPLDPSAPPPAPFVDIEEFDQAEPAKPPKVLGKRGPKPKPKPDKSAFKPKGSKKSVRRVKV